MCGSGSWRETEFSNDWLCIVVVPRPRGKGYVINVASNRNGVGYGAWTHVDGWSEAVVEYIAELEASVARPSK